MLQCDMFYAPFGGGSMKHLLDYSYLSIRICTCRVCAAAATAISAAIAAATEAAAAGAYAAAVAAVSVLLMQQLPPPPPLRLFQSRNKATQRPNMVMVTFESRLAKRRSFV